MQKHYSKVLFIVYAAVIAAIYVVLTLLSASFDLASGAIQVRFSEVLTILPFFTPAGIYGVTLGCFISNIVIGSHVFDIIFGTLATLIACILTGCIGVLYRKTQHHFLKFLAPIPPILSNAIIIPFILVHAYGIPDAIPFLMLTVGIGQAIACGIFGLFLLFALLPVSSLLFYRDINPPNIE